MRASASRDLIAPIEDVWAFLAEPHHLPDWWPGLAAVSPDRRGLAVGARWELRYPPRPAWTRKVKPPALLLVRDVIPPTHAAWHLTASRLDVELRLEARGPDRTRATLSVSGPVVLGTRRELPRNALGRLHALCQTAATL